MFINDISASILRPFSQYYMIPLPRRAGYRSVTQSSEYPLLFCATRWVEIQIDSCAYDQSLLKSVIFGNLYPKESQQAKVWKCKITVEDVLTTAKLSFFSYFASLFEPFLLKYEPQNLMLPYLYTDLVDLFRSVLKLIIKDEVLENRR